MLWKGFEDKSHQRRAHYLKPRGNGRPIPTGAARGAPLPHWLGLSINLLHKQCFGPFPMASTVLM